ncbi:MAG: hypothetical protein BZY75_03355 [SAR202 cluster bacterium Io17-Chloro-G7]|nr:MAG: hypothetical protein BZY75_03355 [SAR202 cluster bacterium Io17-Chloro-G7]
MAFLGKLRSQRHYAAGTLHLMSLERGPTSSAIKELESAIKRLRRAVELNPEFAEAHHNLGNAFIMGAEYNLAVYSLSPHGRDPGDLESFNEEAYIDALNALDKAVSLRLHFPEAHNNRGKALIGLGRYEDALRAFDIAIEQLPSYTKAIENRGTLLRLLESQ